MRFLSGLIILFLSGILSGCVSIPVEQISKEIEPAELSAHVAFLAQPLLKGRRSGSWESNTVRKYLVDRFTAYGLSPWAQCKGFAQPFGLGTNIIGILPGSDLSNEIVILSAHYDHLGKTKDGMCLGAADNASGVAAVLEIAERLSQSDKPLKRTVCFALFDTEEIGMVGSMVFSVRDDYNDANVVAAVTIDMLGRELFDVVDGSLCLAGAEEYPALRKHTAKTATQNYIKLLPVGSDLIGPRGDHVAFNDSGRMSLFFTCGVFSDYHKPADTADKLDYEKMAAMTETIFQTVVELANTPEIEKPADVATSYYDELVALNYILDKIYLNHYETELTDEENKEVSALAEKTRKMLADGDYSEKGRRAFVGDVLTALLPMLRLSDESFAENEKYYLWHYQAFLPYFDDMIAEYKKTLKEAMDNKLAVLISGKDYSFDGHIFDQEDMSLIVRDDGLYEFDIILSRASVHYVFGGLFRKEGNSNISARGDKFGCTGTKEQIIDYCLLLWRETQKQDSQIYADTWPRVFNRINGDDLNQTYQQRLDHRLNSGGFADEKEWFTSLLSSDNTELTIRAFYSNDFLKSEKEDKLIADIITDRTLPSALRDMAIMYSFNSKEVLLAVVDVLEEETVYKSISHLRTSRPSYPLKNHPLTKNWYDLLTEEEKQKHAEKLKKKKTKHFVKISSSISITGKKHILKYYEGETTIGQIAEFFLKTFTGKNFKKDKNAWEKWISDNEINYVRKDKRKVEN